jgi:hypothetical protein
LQRLRLRTFPAAASQRFLTAAPEEVDLLSE